MNRDIKELINRRTILGSKIASGLLACALLASCGKQPPKNETGDNSKIEEAKKIAIEKIGGYGPFKKNDLLKQAAILTKENSPKQTKDEDGNKIDDGYRLIDQIKKENMLQHLMTHEVDTEVRKKFFAKTPKKDRYLDNKISGAYKEFVEAILADDKGDADKKRRGRHGKLFILAEGLSYVRDMRFSLEKDDEDPEQITAEFKDKIQEASDGVHAVVMLEKDGDGNVTSPSVSFKQQTKDKEQYQLTEDSKKAAEKLIKDVQEAREAYRKVYLEEVK